MEKYQQQEYSLFSIHLSSVLLYNVYFFMYAFLRTISNVGVTAKTDLSKFEKL